MHLSFAVLRMHYIFYFIFYIVVLDVDSTVDLKETAKGYASLTKFCTKHCPGF